MDDAKTVELFRKRDGSAIAEVEARYGGRLYAIALRMTGDPHIAEECLNSAYMRAWELIPPADPSEHLFAFMARIVRGIAIDRYRAENALSRKAVTVELTKELDECTAGSRNVEDEAEANELCAVINDFVRSLSGDRRLIFIRRYWYFDTVAEIAKALGFSESKVKTELYRARKKLKSYLERKGYGI